MITPEQATDKVEEGWLKVWLSFEALAVKEEVVQTALKNLLEKLDSDERLKVYKKQFSEPKKLEKPLKNVKEGWSIVAEAEIIVKSFENLINIIIQYGPSATEVLEPRNIKMDIGEAQNILNSVAEMMHRFAAAGVGGMVVVKGKE